MAAHAIDQAATELNCFVERQKKYAHTGANQPFFVIDPSSRSLPQKFPCLLTSSANLSPNSPHLWSHFAALLPQAHLSRDSRCITHQRTLTHLPLVCHLLPYQVLLSHHPWNIIATAGVIRDKPYGFSDLRATFELQIG